MRFVGANQTAAAEHAVSTWVYCGSEHGWDIVAAWVVINLMDNAEEHGNECLWTGSVLTEEGTGHDEAGKKAR